LAAVALESTGNHQLAHAPSLKLVQGFIHAEYSPCRIMCRDEFLHLPLFVVSLPIAQNRFEFALDVDCRSSGQYFGEKLHSLPGTLRHSSKDSLDLPSISRQYHPADLLLI